MYLVVTGPTGVGKTDFAINLAKLFQGEIVNADSVQIYQDFDIGSAKPKKEYFEQMPHHLFSFLNPTEDFDAMSYARLANSKIQEISSRNNTPVVVGGSNFYLRALIDGLIDLPETNKEAQEIIAEREKTYKFQDVDKKAISINHHLWLSELDPETAQRLDKHDYPRIIRALEVFLSTGEKLSKLQNNAKNVRSINRALVLIVNFSSREKLYQRIDDRVEVMFNLGLLEEVRSLSLKYPHEAPPFKTIGYRQVAEYLNGGVSYEQMVDEIKKQTRRFAKRQLTWWRNHPQKYSWQRLDETKEFDLEEIVINSNEFYQSPFYQWCSEQIVRFREAGHKKLSSSFETNYNFPETGYIKISIK